MSLVLLLFLSDNILRCLQVGAERVEFGDGSTSAALVLGHGLVE